MSRGKLFGEQLLTTEHTEIVSLPVVSEWLETSNDSKRLWLLIIVDSLHDMGTANRNVGVGGKGEVG